MIDFTRSILTSLLYFCRLVVGDHYDYSPNNPTVGQTLIVTWFRANPTAFSLALLNDDSNTGPQQIQDVKFTNGQTTGTVRFVPTQPGYVYILIQHSNTILTIDELLDGREL
jgi:hypothetical protein